MCRCCRSAEHTGRRVVPVSEDGAGSRSRPRALLGVACGFRCPFFCQRPAPRRVQILRSRANWRDSVNPEDAPKVPLAAEDACHGDATGGFAVEDEVATNRIAPDPGNELRSKAPGPRHTRQQGATPEDAVHQAVSGAGVVRRDVPPDVDQVCAGRFGEPRPAQARFFRLESRRRPSTFMASAVLGSKGTESPRSRARTPAKTWRRNSANSARRSRSRSSSKRRASRTTSLAEPYRPLLTLSVTSFSRWGVSETFMVIR